MLLIIHFMFLFVVDQPSKSDASSFLVTLVAVTIINIYHALNN